MERSAELLKSFANRIAQAALSEDAARITRLLLVSGFLGGPSGLVPDQSSTGSIDNRDEENNSLAALTTTDHVGIWERSKESGKSCFVRRFVRRMDKFKDWHLWANVERIEPKGAKQRIVLIGESVARGFLYDPVFTPALALEMILQSELGKDEIEVIDLARTNIGHEVGELAVSAHLLDPDLVIIFAGNNWGITFPDPAEIVQTDAVLRKQGIAGVKRLAEAQVARNARSTVNDVAAIYEGKKVPLVWIIPEFNLGDWREPITNAPYLSDGLNWKWTSIREEAQIALENGALSRAWELAKEMVEIDGGVCVAGFYILAECSQRRQNFEAMRRYLELARDAVIWDTSRSVVPRPYSVIQETLRSETSRYKDQIVDMPKLLKEHLKGGIPDRRLFLDYCHLTAGGIQIAMAAAAACVLRSLKGVEIPWYVLAEGCISPAREVEAEALFLAAVHNAHWSQSYELVYNHCLQSLELSAHVAQIMISYLDLQTRRTTPTLMCQSAEQIAELGSPLIARYLFPRNRQRFDRLLLDAIVDALNKVGVDVRERLDQMRRDEHSIVSSEINLLDYYYCSSVDQPQEVEWARPTPEDDVPFKEANYYKAYGPYSRFIFVGEAGYPLQLCLTCRLPEQAPFEGIIVVEVNGKSLVQITIDREWETWDIEVAGGIVRDGVNEIIIRWPIYKFESSKAFENVTEDLLQWKKPELYHTFGEIHSFTASDGRNISTTNLSLYSSFQL